MIDENVAVRVSPATLRTLVRRTLPDISAVGAIAGIMMVFVALVSATSVVGASSGPLDTDTTSGLVPDVPTDVEQPCAPDASTVATTTTMVASTTTTVPAIETTTEGVESCDDTSTDSPEPVLAPTTNPPTPPTTPPDGSTPPPEITATTPPTTPPVGSTPPPEITATTTPTAIATEAPPPPTQSDDVSTPLDTSVSVTDTAPAVTPPAVTPPAVTPPVTDPITPPSIPAVSGTWTTGVIRAGAPRDPGPSALLAGRTPAGQRVVRAGHVEVILTTIRQLESGGRYDIGLNKAKASGAYQYIPSTWSHEGGYPHAYLAPPEVQDARARSDVERFLAMYGGDVSMVPVMWYYPRAASDPKWMDRVPNPAGGNRLTIREYQARWMEQLARNAQDMLGAGGPVPTSSAAVSVLTAFPDLPDEAEFEPPRFGLTAPAAIPGSAEADQGVEAALFALDAVTVSDHTMEYAARSVPPEVTEEHAAGSMRSIVFPVLGPVVYANGWGDPRDGGERRHEGTDIIGVTMQPLLAATDGQITQLRLEPRGRSGVAMSIRDADGWRYNYFHANNDTPTSDDGEAHDGFRLAPGLELGDRVIAGQIIGYMGDSGNAEGSVPHLHFEFRDPRGRPAPSFRSLQAAEARQACTVGIGPWSTPALTPEIDLDTVEQVDTDTVEPATAEPERSVWHTVVTPIYGEGQWVIDSDGRVTATGDAALVMPSRTLECAPGPATPFGTDAGGWARFDHDALTGTVLDGADLTGTVLDSQLAERSVARSHDPLLEPMVFTDPASGQRIIVTFWPSPDEFTRLPTSADRPAGSPASLGPTGRREPKRAANLDAKLRRTTVLRI